MHLKKKPLIFDGAMGTYYVSAGKSKSLKCELANIYDSETILGTQRICKSGRSGNQNKYFCSQ